MGRLIAKMQAAGIDKDVFISPKDALEEATDESLLVLTDHSKYSITYDPELYDRLKNRLIIIDHHRRGKNSLKIQCWYTLSRMHLRLVSL